MSKYKLHLEMYFYYGLQLLTMSLDAVTWDKVPLCLKKSRRPLQYGISTEKEPIPQVSDLVSILSLSIR